MSAEPNVRRKCCSDCGCRRNSPLTPITADPMELAQGGVPFYCHEGAAFDEYGEFTWVLERGAAPPLKVDGTPADLCAGWSAYRRAALRGAL